MKFTLSWLKDHLETEASLGAIGDALTNLGLEVEGVENKAGTLSAFRVAHVLAAEPHPNADKLRVCKVDTGAEILQVVCGAPNARAGMKAVFAPVGATIPGSGLTLTAATIRGVASNGMLCSERELELSTEHDGIIDLPPDAPVGASFAEFMGLDDPVVEIAITPNRGDCLAVHGIARDLAAAGQGTLKPGAVAPVPGGFKSPIKIGLKFDGGAAAACPLFAGRLIRGVKNGPSPAWLQKRLRAIGLRPINALVDVTNYISFDRARPLHVYDAAKIAGGIHARLARKGETLLALDGKNYALDEAMCVIADERGVLGLAGVMGGAPSGSTEATTDVFIESALFDPIRTAATGRALQILSDARYRFERGVDAEFVIPGLELATRMILEICGGEASAVEIAGQAPPRRAPIDFSPADVARLTGLALDKAEIAAILKALGFGLTEADARFAVSVPSWRPDVHGSADLVEEVVRVAGLARVPSTPLPNVAAPAPMLGSKQKRARMARRALAARGFVEAVSYSFIPSAHAALFGAEKPIRLANPISADLDAMRPSGLPALIAAAGRNAARGISDSAFFEVGPVFHEAGPAGQSLVAAGIRRGLNAPRHWSKTSRAVEALDAKADVEALLAFLGVSPHSAQIHAGGPSWYHPGRSGLIKLGPKTVLARFGEIHPYVLEAMDVKGPMTGFEIFLDEIPEPKAKPTKSRGKLDAPDLMPLERDFAFIVDAAVPAGDVLRAARAAAKAVDWALIDDVMLFDVFTGESVGAGKKSVAITVRIQPKAKTLTDEEIEALSGRVLAAVTKATGAVLRR